MRLGIGLLCLTFGLAPGCQCGTTALTALHPQIETDPAAVDFGVTGPGFVVERTVNLRNPGVATLTLTEVTLAGDVPTLFFVKSVESLKLEPGASGLIHLTYAPTTEGSHAARLVVKSNAANAPELFVSLAGTAALGGECASVSCTNPPGPCLAEIGTCLKGVCTYAPLADATTCDDADACTEHDQCVAGLCQGTGLTCATPPAPTCFNDHTRRTFDSAGSCEASGQCTYAAHDIACPSGCDSSTSQCRSPCDPGYEPCATGCCLPAISSGVACGWDHTCAIVASTGAVKCWGSNTRGQLGLPGGEQHFPGSPVTNVESGALALAAGTYHTCALVTPGAVKCWGQNEEGQLGNGSRGTTSHVAVSVFGLTTGVTAVAAGVSHSCALLTSGGVKCWGSNSKGQLGDGTTTNRPKPVDVDGLSYGVVALAAYEFGNCVLLDSGGVKCWGWNLMGEVGDETTTDRHTPTDVLGLSSGVSSIAAGYQTVCAVMSTGKVKCWGLSFDGRPGGGGDLSPQEVLTIPGGVSDVFVGEQFLCTTLNAGGVQCMGHNAAGQTGTGVDPAEVLTVPLDVPGLTGVSGASAGLHHACVTLTAGGLRCWGDNALGQLGDGTTNMALTPVVITGL